MSNNIAFVILAGGQGLRLNQHTPKQFIKVAGKSLLEHSFCSLSSCDANARMIVVVPADAMVLARRLLAGHPRAEFVVGGSNRQASTWEALKFLKENPPLNVVIHDAARPFLSAQIVHDVLQALEQYEAVDVAIPTADTIIIERDGFIQSIPKRKHIYRGQTPQGFLYAQLYRAYQEIGELHFSEYTDDCGIYMACNPLGKVRIVSGSSENIKITEDIDMVLADELFRIKKDYWKPESKGLNVKGKRVLIFGGNKGIGAAITRILIESGATVLTASRSSQCDISNFEQVDFAVTTAADQMGGIDYVVNTVGLLSQKALHLQDFNEVENILGVNLLGSLFVAKSSHQYLLESSGMLLNFSSSSYTRGRAHYTPYSASKAGVVNLTQGLAEEWADSSIKVNCIVPGRTDTEMRRSNFEGEASDTLLNPFEVALSACKLLSSDLTGMIFRV